ncbi:DUF5107 domain-containing protein [Streptomyces sp. MST-110588]|uniref:DUF5107 domain-containing protein n=1 Tax=Streptomyces sp. MST-110588 TaxID=2833628 RepID=UPI001F5CD280|nr:DUF5107 domain-containing protein [Streptomyces sp. MST-110588]UNO39235.1 DUF5107 domain-containing protein [Streptomyces sp. MST-110588]
MATRVRRTTLTLPAAPLGPDNPLPALRPPRDAHRAAIEPAAKEDAGGVGTDPDAALPADMARGIAYEPLRSLLPVRRRDGYGRQRSLTTFDAIVIENDRLRATVLPGLGGRVYSLHHKPTDRELLHRNPVLQPADFALNGAWFSGGIEWNIGATGHSALTCAPLHAARVPAPDGGTMLRLWEWERLRDLPFQVDLWLPADSDFLYVGVRVRNPHLHAAPVYWWSNIAVPEGPATRVLAPAEKAWHFGYERSLRRVPVPVRDGVDRTYPLNSEFPADYFYEIPDGARRWIASLDGEGHGLVHTSTDTLRGRKLFLWGAGRAGRRWQEWLTEPGAGGYAEIQAGLARTQLEHLRLEGGGELSWLEAYGPLAADPATVHGADWAAARAEAGSRLAAALPRTEVDAAYAAWRPYADAEPKERLATGSGWGALERARGDYDLPGTPFEEDTLGEEQRPWLELLHTGDFPAGGPVPAAPLVSRPWRDLLECAHPGPVTDYHLGIAQWHAGDRAQAVRSWERALTRGADCRPLYCLAEAEWVAGETERAAELYTQACRCASLARTEAAGAALRARTERGGHGQRQAEEEAQGWGAVLRALVRQAVPVLLAAGRAGDAADALAQLPPADRIPHGRFELLTAQVMCALGDARGARAVFDRGFEVADLRESEETISDTWYAIAERLVAGDGPVTDAVRETARAEHPLPGRYEFRMRPV